MACSPLLSLRLLTLILSSVLFRGDRSAAQGLHQSEADPVVSTGRHHGIHSGTDPLHDNRTAFQMWAPGWWSDHLDHWQEVPAAIDNPLAPYNGQDGEDQFAEDMFFWGKTHGIFMEVGGLDGVQFSNTLFYSQARAWRGLLIEASPTQYPAMVANRKNDVNLHAAVCGKHQDVHYVDNQAVGGIYEFMSDGFRSLYHSDVDVSTLPVVPCLPLHAILAKLRVPHINFWSLDVEGGELQVLHTFDFKKVQVDVICVEADGSESTKDAEVVSFLETQGFRHYGHVVRNNWFLHSNFQPKSNPALEQQQLE